MVRSGRTAATIYKQNAVRWRAPVSAASRREPSARESVAGAKRRRLTRLGRCEVRVLCGAGFEGAVAKRAQAK